MVLYTGYEHTYTIVEASPFDEGTYMCSVYGTDSRIVTPQSVYVNVIAGEILFMIMYLFMCKQLSYVTFAKART